MKKKYITQGVTMCAIAIVFFACAKKTSTIDPNVGKEYFPISTGKALTYRVDSTIYDDFTGTTKKSVSYIKDVIDTSFVDLIGQTSYYVKRYYKNDTATDFEFLNLYTLTPFSNRVEVVFDNLRYIKLVFPVTYQGTWGGNKFINTNTTKEPYSWLGDKPYSYKDLGKPHSNDSITFANTLTVFQKNELSGDTSSDKTQFGEYIYGLEKYGKDAGMVFKELIYFKKDPNVGGGLRKGFAMKMNCIKVE
jgi:hypothetical protein